MTITIRNTRSTRIANYYKQLIIFLNISSTPTEAIVTVMGVSPLSLSRSAYRVELSVVLGQFRIPEISYPVDT